MRITRIRVFVQLAITWAMVSLGGLGVGTARGQMPPGSYYPGMPYASAAPAAYPGGAYFGSPNPVMLTGASMYQQPPLPYADPMSLPASEFSQFTPPNLMDTRWQAAHDPLMPQAIGGSAAMVCDCNQCDDCGCQFSLNTPLFIDSAIVRSQIRTRVDLAYDFTVPDRAEFLFARGRFLGGNANGPPLPESSTDYQDLMVYLEHAPLPWLSGFVEVPVRFVNPVVNANEVGLSDINAGFKVAIQACSTGYTTFQFRVYAPSGQADQGLGAGHVSLEPAVLYYRELTRNIDLWGEVRGWMPIGDSKFLGAQYAGDHVRYGLGLSLDVLNYMDCCPCGWSLNESLAATVEFVGWSLIDGQGFDAATTQLIDVTGDTIVNGMLGLRYTRNRHSIAVSYGKVLSDNEWYNDIIRFEHRITF